MSINADLPYKAAIDALGRMADDGTVVRIGRKYSAEWALSGNATALPDDPMRALEALWHARPPTPHGGEAQAPPGLRA